MMFRKVLALGLALAAITVLVANFNARKQEDSTRIDNRSLRQVSFADPKTVESKSTRPVMHTFFHGVQHMGNGHKGTGMTDNADQVMLQLWKDSWTAAGWYPKVLTLEEAKLHPNFENYTADLEKVPMLGAKNLGVNKEYNQLCYIRWLAMVVVGGGWMCDYDVLPLTQDLNPIFEGEFNVYSTNSKEKQATPCLMSGTHQGWDKMAHAILQNGLQHPDANLWSDMFALTDIWDSHPYGAINRIIDGGSFLTGAPWSEKDCERFKAFDAVHFSHYMVVAGTMREGEDFEDRPRIAQAIIEKFQKVCMHQSPRQE